MCVLMNAEVCPSCKRPCEACRVRYADRLQGVRRAHELEVRDLKRALAKALGQETAPETSDSF